MASPFLERFVDQVVGALLSRGEIEITPGSQRKVAGDVADGMTRLGEGFGAISSLSKGLIAHPDVIELYADDDDLKEIVGGLGPAWMRAG